MSNKILRLSQVINYTGMSRSSIYLLMSQGSFPLSISLGARAVGWVESEIQLWIDKRIKERRNSGVKYEQ
ncbi:helix-turn-helix transcriptional regulator [Rosenbergiella collisarenosi]|uniref:helix-turn-helix transcriptional regulator n=1 Tax=Rosenbergiella collisarenosi TaxID=1544695 RepID=UPI001F4FCCFB|nr:AlpA family transcriptional regulator [Rosenbergiella collisarenosi]